MRDLTTAVNWNCYAQMMWQVAASSLFFNRSKNSFQTQKQAEIVIAQRSLSHSLAATSLVCPSHRRPRLLQLAQVCARGWGGGGTHCS